MLIHLNSAPQGQFPKNWSIFAQFCQFLGKKCFTARKSLEAKVALTVFFAHAWSKHTNFGFNIAQLLPFLERF